jgi:hypothetical protein
VNVLDWIHSLAEDRYQTMWIEVQAIATIAAFLAAATYAWIARRQMRTTEAQLRMAEGQLRAMKEERRGSRLARVQDNKPTVVIDRREDTEHRSDSGWVLANIGRGFAVNVFEIDPHSGRWRSLGGLAAGAERPIPHWLHGELNASDERKRWESIILAEGASSRTRRWNPTLNLLCSDGSVVHLFAYPHGDHDTREISMAESQLDLEAYLKANVPLLRKQLTSVPVR